MKRLLTLHFAIATIGLAVLATGPTCVLVLAQDRMNYSIVGQNTGHMALGLAIRKLGVYGTFMQAPAHPDDETNALFAMFTVSAAWRHAAAASNRRLSKRFRAADKTRAGSIRRPRTPPARAASRQNAPSLFPCRHLRRSPSPAQDGLLRRLPWTS